MTFRTRQYLERRAARADAWNPISAPRPNKAAGNASHECVPTSPSDGPPAAQPEMSRDVFAPDAGQDGHRGAGLLSGSQKRFLWAWQALQGPELAREHAFHPIRKWRFDFAHVPSKVAIELEGGTWSASRHTTGAGFRRDCEKYNAAVLAGWRVFRLTTDMLRLHWLAPIRHLIAEAKP
jgi:very-short-patch-repair endonuclease